ncbi:MAG: bifunctional 3-deoxy-7-phosphoheptulonate synthase/chorismate mutase [Deltaproteobacteria bacterium]|nr:bifunctional 3-deoxy-7-phosphoheptulonate synthase/chorismate mutase [Deltaproteobacteria bacterium]
MKNEPCISDKNLASLDSVREDINKLDEQLLELLVKRRGLSAEIIAQKDKGSAEVRDLVREQKLLRDRIRYGKEHGLDAHYVTRLFHEILDDSIRSQHNYLMAKEVDQSAQRKRVAYHGIAGSYCHLASEQYFEGKQIPAIYAGYPSFSKVIEAVKSDEVDYALIPVQNTTRGSINEVVDLLLNSRLYIVGEEKYRVDHCLLGLPDSNLADIKKVCCSHLAFLDCRHFLRTFCEHIEYHEDSAIAANYIHELGDKTCAAIASERAAEIYGLQVLKRGICSHKDNFVRSLLVSKTQAHYDLRVPCKTSILFATPNHSGALVEALVVFRDRGINLTKLESHPIAGNPWEEMFYLDFEGNLQDPTIDSAIKELTRCTRFLRVMGSYPSIDIARVTPDFCREDNESTAISGRSAASANTANVDSLAADKIVTTEQSKPKKKRSYRLVSRDHRAEDLIINVSGVKIGGNGFVVMAGPCSVESQQQIMQCARHASECGAKILRGGCFKPRTSPYSFQGLGFEGLELLKAAGEAYGLPIITEVMAPEDVEGVAKKSDMLQIGARNMQNFTLLKAVGATPLPVLLKRGMSSSIDDLLNAAEYILAHGNHEVILCERGIRTFETATRATLDLSAVPVLKRETYLPVIVDPSHAAGERDLVPPLAIASKAIGAHGIIVEFHPEPEKALSDGEQALRFKQFEALMHELL